MNNCEKSNREKTVSKICRDYENNRLIIDTNQPEIKGSTDGAGQYKYQPFQGGDIDTSSLKIDYGSKGNKVCLPGLSPDLTFNLVPDEQEAGEYNDEIIKSGFGPNAPRDQANQWYGITMDSENFYYSVWGQSTFTVLFGGGASTIFVCRKKCDASLVWVKSVFDYLVTDPSTPNDIGSSTMLGRITLAIHKNRLYTTTMLSSIGPQLLCIDKRTGDRIWSAAYDLPPKLIENLGKNILISPTDVPFNSYVITPELKSQTMAVGDLHIVVTELNGKPSIFPGVSSYQNAVNPAGFSGFPLYTDQGSITRIDDLGNTPQFKWKISTCAENLKVGDQLNKIDDQYNPFRPDSSEVIIWRDTDDTGLFNTLQGAKGRVMNYLTDIPGYKPNGYPLVNNNTMPIVSNILLLPNGPVITESMLPEVWKNGSPRIGNLGIIYTNTSGTDPNTSYTINQLIDIWNDLQTTIITPTKFVYWAYITQDQINAIDAEEYGASNLGIRYASALPLGYIINNDQEANSLGYYGNSIWGQSPVIDLKRNALYTGTGQSHSAPLDEILFYNNPEIEFYNRKQGIVNIGYDYSGVIENKSATLEDVNNTKKIFMNDNQVLCYKYDDKSPRGNRSYADSILSLDLDTGEILYGARTLPSDVLTFITDDPSSRVINTQDPDADLPTGVSMFKDIDTLDGSQRTVLTVSTKGGIFMSLDITSFNRTIKFNNQNLLELGIIPKYVYLGPTGALGGSNFITCNTGGKYLVYGNSNNSLFNGSRSFDPIYQNTPSLGYEFHITKSGDIFGLQNSFVGAIDITNNNIEWETNIGSLSHPAPKCYNGVIYTTTDNGFVNALDAVDGKFIWKFNGQVYNWAGISTPILEYGKAYIINNYDSAATGSNGNIGAIMKIDTSKVLIPKDTINQLVSCGVYKSYDMIPKLFNPINQPIFSNNLFVTDKITHSWVCNKLHGTHYNPIDDTTKEINVIARKFSYSSKEIEIYPTENDGIRYLSIRMFNTDSYLLKYQRLEDEVWNNYEAFFDLYEPSK